MKKICKYAAIGTLILYIMRFLSWIVGKITTRQPKPVIDNETDAMQDYAVNMDKTEPIEIKDDEIKDN